MNMTIPKYESFSSTAVVIDKEELDAKEEPQSSTSSPIDDHDSSSVDTQEAFLDMLGLGDNLNLGDCEEEIVVGSTKAQQPAGNEGANNQFVTEASKFPLPRKCARHYGENPEEQHLALYSDNFVPPQVCQELIQIAHVNGFQYVRKATHMAPDGTTTLVDIAKPNPHKLAVFGNDRLLGVLWNNVQPLLNTSPFKEFQKRTQAGPPLGLNPKLRVLKYDSMDDDRFEPHFDAATVVGDRTSRITVLLYLNSSSVDFEGGETLYLDYNTSTHGVQPMAVDTIDSSAFSVVPQQGRLVLFEHNLYHASAPLLRGTKYVMRTDILFATPEDEADSLETRHSEEPESTLTTVASLVTNDMSLSPQEIQILKSMDILDDMTCESFVAPGITLMKQLLVDGGMNVDTAMQLIQAAQSKKYRSPF